MKAKITNVGKKDTKFMYDGKDYVILKNGGDITVNDRSIFTWLIKYHKDNNIPIVPGKHCHLKLTLIPDKPALPEVKAIEGGEPKKEKKKRGRG